MLWQLRSKAVLRRLSHQHHRTGSRRELNRRCTAHWNGSRNRISGAGAAPNALGCSIPPELRSVNRSMKWCKITSSSATKVLLPTSARNTPNLKTQNPNNPSLLHRAQVASADHGPANGGYAPQATELRPSLHNRPSLNQCPDHQRKRSNRRNSVPNLFVSHSDAAY